MDIELLKHLKSDKLFVLLDDSRIDRYKVINPAGAKMLMPAELFDDELILTTRDKAREFLTAEQFSAMEKEFISEESQAAQMQAHLDKKQAEIERASRSPAISRATSSTTRSSAPKKRPKEDKRRGLGAAWSSSMLTFYRHHIDPLGPKQSFKVTIDQIGVVEMTKEDFQTVFNDVIMSSNYRQDGYFGYPSFPEKAKRFLKNG